MSVCLRGFYDPFKGVPFGAKKRMTNPRESIANPCFADTNKALMRLGATFRLQTPVWRDIEQVRRVTEPGDGGGAREAPAINFVT